MKDTWAVIFHVHGIDDIPLVYTFDTGSAAEAWMGEGLNRRPGSAGMVVRLRRAPPWPVSPNVIPFKQEA